MEHRIYFSLEIFGFLAKIRETRIARNGKNHYTSHGRKWSRRGENWDVAE